MNKYRYTTFYLTIAIVMAFLAGMVAVGATSPIGATLGAFVEALGATWMGFLAAKTYYQSPG